MERGEGWSDRGRALMCTRDRVSTAVIIVRGYYGYRCLEDIQEVKHFIPLRFDLAGLT